MGSEARQQAIAIARQYYIDGLSKVQIAQQHGISRFKVASILEKSLETGLVRIEIADDGRSDEELSDELRAKYKLNHAVVVSAPTDQARLRSALGRAAAELLTELIRADDVLGVAWGRTLSAMAPEVHDLPPCPIVQLTGITGSAAANSIDVVRQLLSASRGAHFPLYAPLIVPDAQTAAGLARQPSIRLTTSQWRLVTVAMVAVGSWDANGSQLYPVLEPADHKALARHTIAAEMCATLFTPEGRPLKTPLVERAMAIPYDELMKIPEVVAVAGGTGKAAALRSVLSGRAVTSVVTDATVARELLAGEVALLAGPTRRSRGKRAS